MRQFASRHLIVFCALLAAGLLAATADAQQRAQGGMTPGGIAEGRLMKKSAKELELSEEILAKIDASIAADTAEEEKFREMNTVAVTELSEILAQKMPSEKALMAASDKVGEIASKSRALKMKSVIRVRSLLTKEQLDKFMAIRGEAVGRR